MIVGFNHDYFISDGDRLDISPGIIAGNYKV